MLNKKIIKNNNKFSNNKQIIFIKIQIGKNNLNLLAEDKLFKIYHKFNYKIMINNNLIFKTKY